MPRISTKKTILPSIKYPKIKEKLNKWGERISSDKISKGDYWGSPEAGKVLHEAGKKASVGNIAKGTQNTKDYAESSDLGKSLHEAGEKVSIENIGKGIENTKDYAESSKTGKDLHEAGKKVSVGDIVKGTQNTIDYAESSDLGKSLHEAGEKVSVGNIVKGAQNTKDYWESSEAGKVLHEQGKKANDYIYGRVIGTKKKLTASWEAESPGEWWEKLWMRRIKRRPPPLYTCARNYNVYNRLGYTKEQSAILNYFLFDKVCDEHHYEAINDFSKYFSLVYNKLLLVHSKSGDPLNNNNIEQVISQALNNTYQAYGFEKKSTNTAMAFTLTDDSGRWEEIQFSEGGDTYYEDLWSDGDYYNTPNDAEGSAGITNPGPNSLGEKPEPEKKKKKPPFRDIDTTDTDNSEQRRMEHTRKFHAKMLTKKIVSFKSYFNEKFYKPLLEDTRTIISMHKKIIDLTKDIVLKLASDEVKDKIVDAFEKGFRKSLNVPKLVAKGPLEVTKMINTTYETYLNKTLDYVKKDDPEAKIVQSQGTPSAYAAIKAQNCGCTVWKGLGDIWYYHPDPNYPIKSRSIKIRRGNSPYLPGNNRPDNRPDSFVTDVLKDAMMTYLQDSSIDAIKSTLKGAFKKQLKD